MSIEYTYGNMGLVGLAAGRAGANTAARRDRERAEELAFKTAQLNQKQNQFDQNLAYRQGWDQKNYNLRIAENLWRDQQQANQNQFDFQRQVALAGLQQQLNQQNAVFNDELNFQTYQDRSLVDQAAQRDRDQYQFGLGAAEQVDQTAKDLLSQYRKLPLNEQGQQTLAEFSARIRRVQGQKGSLRPGQYAQAMGGVVAEMEEAGIGDYVEQLPTIESMKQSGQLVEAEDGSGWWSVEFRDSQAIPRFIPKPKADSGGIDPDKQPIETLWGQMTPEKAAKAKSDLVKRAQEQLMAEAMTPGSATEKPKYPGKDAIIQRARELMEIEQELFGSSSSGSTTEPDVPPLESDTQVSGFDSADELTSFLADPDATATFFAGPDGKIYYRTDSGKILRDDSWGTLSQ